MSATPRLESKFLFCSFGIIGVGAAIALFLSGSGCNNRGEPTKPVVSTNRTEDPIAASLARLEREDAATTCLDALQTVNQAIERMEARPGADSSAIADLSRSLKLNVKESEALAQPLFTSVDAEYLADCFLVRDCVQSLELKNFPPSRKAELVFAWVCRQIYLSHQAHPPAPAWWLLQAGSGSSIDRAAVFLEALRQMGLDGCLIGPPVLAKAPIVSLEKKGGRIYYAPVRAVGVRIAGDIFLFDPSQGKPIQAKDSQKSATLAQIRSNPAAFPDWLAAANLTADEIKSWEVFLAPPLLSLAPRMEWLERQIPKSNAVRLHVDLPKMLERFQKETLMDEQMKGVTCRIWNVENDLYSPLRIQDTFHREVKVNGSLFRPVREGFRESHFPKRFVPELTVKGISLGGEPKRRIEGMFRREFASIFLVHESPRDHLLRGNFSNATASLTDLKERNDRYRDRIAREQNLDASVELWAKEASPIFAALLEATESGDSNAISRAREAEERFLKSELSEKMAYLVRRETSRLIGAETAYQLSLVMQERAERADARYEQVATESRRADAERLWLEAIDSWQRYLVNYPELRGEFPDRDAHAQALQDRCKLGLARAKK
ncbi:MAG: hypothetical protein K8T89_07065 [Planctomycetes bacterium]|nr:hypothetical protein [Planctomycetota bacterium]